MYEIPASAHLFRMYAIDFYRMYAILASVDTKRSGSGLVGDELAKAVVERRHQKAHSIFASAVKRGKLTRPVSCSQCAAVPPRGKDGRSQIQGHHPDYSKPLEVVWLCVACHRAVTPLPIGPRTPQAVLTEELVRTIRASPMGAKEFAIKHGLSRRTVSDAKAGRWWKWVS